MMELAYLGAICLTLIILVTNVAGHVSSAKKRAAELKAEVDKRQIESAFPPERPEKPSLEQQQFDAAEKARQQKFDTERVERKALFDAKDEARTKLYNSKNTALMKLLERRQVLESEITNHRTKIIGSNQDKAYNQYRADAMKSLENAREELALLVGEEKRMLEVLHRGENREPQVDAPEEPVRIATGGPVAQRVDDPDLLHDAESDEPEASRESTA